MVRCYFSKKHQWGRSITALFAIFDAGVLAGLGGYFLWTEADLNVRMLAGGVLGLGLMIGLFGIVNDLVLTREYAIDPNGITLRYAGRKRVFHPWSQVSQICVCVIHPGKLECVRDEVIWCNLGKARRLPPRRKNWEYEVFHFRSVLTVEFTPERLEAFRLCSGRDIPDYRHFDAPAGITQEVQP